METKPIPQPKDPKLLELLQRNQRKFEKELALKLALYDAGMLAVLREADIAEQMGLSVEQLREFRRVHEADIIRFKDEIFISKTNLLVHVKERLGLAEQLSHLRLEGKDEEADKLHKLLVELDKVMPTSMIKDILGMIKDMNDEDQKQRMAIAPVQINIRNHPALLQAEEDMKRVKDIS